MATDPRVGTILDGQYRLDRLLGVGGVGTVYAATHLHMMQERAIKLLHAPYANAGEPLLRFQREARVISSLPHPSIVRVYDFGDAPDGTNYMAMELVRGRSLRERLADGPLPLGEVLGLFQPLCEALSQAHEKGVLHRDLKPDNLILVEGGGVKILDFGMAKLLSEMGDLTPDKVVMGTPNYLAPERARGKRNVDRTADIFSLGALLYESLTGRMAFVGESTYATMVKVIKEPVAPLEMDDQELASRLDLVIATACAKDPPDRYQSALALWTALELAVRVTQPSGASPDPEAELAALADQRPGFIKAGVLKATLAFVRAQHGEEGLERLAVTLGRERVEEIMAALPTAWLGMGLLHELHRAITRLFDDGSLGVMRQLGRYFADIALNTVNQPFLIVGDPDRMMRRAGLMFRAWTPEGDLDVRENGPGDWRVRLSGYAGLTPALWMASTGGIERILERGEAPDLKVEQWFHQRDEGPVGEIRIRYRA